MKLEKKQRTTLTKEKNTDSNLHGRSKPFHFLTNIVIQIKLH